MVCQESDTNGKEKDALQKRQEKSQNAKNDKEPSKPHAKSCFGMVVSEELLYKVLWHCISSNNSRAARSGLTAAVTAVTSAIV